MAFKKELGRVAGTSLNSVVENARGVIQKVGKAGLHTLAPDNFEYYMCSLELLDSLGETKGFMTFPIMPNSIMENKTQIATLTKTNRGVVMTYNNSFVMRDISIQGTFGRRFRTIVGAKEVKNGVAKFPILGGNLGFNFMSGGVMIKTGYGLTKMLKNMIEASTELDINKKPCILIFNNYALNTQYVVEVLQSSFSQSVENNMLWYYSLEMKAIAPASAVKVQKRNNSLLRNVASNAIASGIGNVLMDVKRSASKW